MDEMTKGGGDRTKERENNKWYEEPGLLSSKIYDCVSVQPSFTKPHTAKLRMGKFCPLSWPRLLGSSSAQNTITSLSLTLYFLLSLLGFSCRGGLETVVRYMYGNHDFNHERRQMTSPGLVTAQEGRTNVPGQTEVFHSKWN